ncbi:glycosyltransferase [Corynebacterium qintianiae]|uniref:Glycosyltransferase n=1 Tax=Corynebacterium qintianiae TaxID=2709392 RepID=A0A7T0KLZ7_9CORY|nr:glycosyltransferase [Corynebacterium qintianiae]QPK82779.1 glycosyltransferase [Corynebacterium qintianiae]
MEPEASLELRENANVILGFFTSSMPHTQSGYSIRTQDVLKAWSQTGLEFVAITRVGYPLIVGRVPSQLREIWNGIEYRRIIPFVFRSSGAAKENLAVRALCAAARECNADLLYTTTDYKNATVVAKAAKICGLPWFYEVRGEMEKTWVARASGKGRDKRRNSEYYEKVRRAEEKCMHAAAQVIALSETSKGELCRRGIDSAKISVIPNSVDDHYFSHTYKRGDIREALGLPSGQWIGSVTSVVGYEGLDTLIKALRYLPSDMKVLIVGEGDCRPELEALAQREGFQDRVWFVGRQPYSEIWKWYAALDIFVLPRRDVEVCRHVTPLKALPAQALGVPVVASDLPAVREITGNIAHYFRADDPRELARAICLAYRNTVRLSEDGKRWAESRTRTQMSKQYKQLFMFTKRGNPEGE